MDQFSSTITDLLRRPDIQRLSRMRDHHFQQNRLEHCIATAKLSFWAGRILRADARVCARAGLLHDWYFERRGDHENRIGANVHHYLITAANARGIGESSDVIHCVETHMWPYGRRAPKTREAWIVWMADNVTWCIDALRSSARYLMRKVRLFLYGRPSKGIPHAA